MSARGTQRGAALILVLWLVVALSLVVLAGARSARLYTQRVALELERMRVEPMLEAATQLVALKLMEDKKLASGFRRLTLHFAGGEVGVEVVPAEGLIDVTVASPEVLEGLFQRVGGLSPGEAAVLNGRIADFLDPDDTPGGVGGAEAAQYQAEGSPYRPRNAGIDDLTELRAVLGMTTELYDIISPFLSVNGGQRIEINSAPPALIDALSGQPGLGEQIYAAPPEMKAGALQSEAMAGMFTSTSSSGETVRLRAVMQTANQRSWERLVWLDLGTRPDAATPWTTRSIQLTHRVRKPEQELMQ